MTNKYTNGHHSYQILYHTWKSFYLDTKLEICSYIFKSHIFQFESFLPGNCYSLINKRAYKSCKTEIVHFWKALLFYVCFPGSTADKADSGDLGLIPESGRSPGEGHGNLLQYSSLENPKDRGTWWARVHRVTKSLMWLNTAQCISLCNRNRYLFLMMFQSGSIYWDTVCFIVT